MVLNDPRAAGVTKSVARQLAKGAGLRGEKARAFKADHADLEITAANQKKRFDISYRHEEAGARRLATRQDVVEKYGATDRAKLHPAIRQVLVDMKFRGDCTGNARAVLQSTVVKNDPEGFTTLMSDTTHRKNVPGDRSDRRVKFLQSAVTVQEPAAARMHALTRRHSAP